MKKIVIFFLITCLLGSLSAQRIQFQQGEKNNKSVTTKPQLVHILECMQDGQLLVVEPIFNPAKKTKAIKVRLCDMEWKDVKDVRIDDTKNYKIETAFRNGDKLHLLLSFVDNDLAKLRHIEIDANSLGIVSDNALINKKLNSSERSVIKSADSPDGTCHGVVFMTENEANPQNPYSVSAFLFDNDMKQVWKHDWNLLTFIEAVILTDNGELVVASCSVGENQEKTLFLFDIVDAEGTRRDNFFQSTMMDRMALLNYNDGKVLLTAFEGEGSPYGRPGDRQYSGIYACCYDINTRKSVSEQHYKFTPDDMRIFENARANDRVDATTNFLNVVDYCATPQGGAVLVNKNWKYELRGKSDNDRVFNIGMLLFQLDMEGKITRVTPIRQNNINIDWPPVGTDMFLYNDKLYIVTNESDNETDQYTPENPAMAPITMFKANTALAIYSVTSDGQVSKQMVEKERKAYLGSPLFKGKDNKFYFISGSPLYPTKLSSITIP